MEMRSHSPSLLLYPTRHLLNFRLRSTVYPKNSLSSPIGKIRSLLATNITTAFAAYRVRRLERKASCRRARSTKVRRRKRGRRSEGTRRASMQGGGRRAASEECLRALELRVMKWRGGLLRSSIYNHQLSFRRMYFKQRENSLLYKHYRQEEQARHLKQLELIKTRKLKRTPSQNILPPITHRLNVPKPHQKAFLQAETDRLGKRLHQLKTHRSQYFSKVIGVNLSGEWRKQKEEMENKSAVYPKVEQSIL